MKKENRTLSLTDKDLHNIQTYFSLPQEKVKMLIEGYEKKIKPEIKKEYLSHVVSVLEKIVRKEKKDPFFSIILRPVENAKIHQCTAEYIGGKKIGSSYEIRYPKTCITQKESEKSTHNIDPKDIRLGIAHELGHLYTMVLLKKESSDFKGDESISSLFGIVTIVDKDNFYRNEAKSFCFASSSEVISAMEGLHPKSTPAHY